MRKIEKLALTARSSFLASALLLLATGFTDCDSFIDVTVPAYDFEAPITYDGVWVGGHYIRAALTGNSFKYHLALGETVTTVASAIDSGGIKKIEMHSGSSWTCCESSGICSLTQPLSVAQTDQQAGGVGSTVSDGMWLYTTGGAGGCPSGSTLRSFSYSWHTVAEDFHGNRTTGQTQSIVYP